MSCWTVRRILARGGIASPRRRRPPEHRVRRERMPREGDAAPGRRQPPRLSPKAVELVNLRLRDKAALFHKEFVTTRTDIPRRTDIDAPIPYRQNKHVLYGQQEGRCGGCDTHFEFRHFEVDHIENLQLLCGHCNRVKGDRPQEYLLAHNWQPPRRSSTIRAPAARTCHQPRQPGTASGGVLRHIIPFPKPESGSKQLPPTHAPAARSLEGDPAGAACRDSRCGRLRGCSASPASPSAATSGPTACLDAATEPRHPPTETPGLTKSLLSCTDRIAARRQCLDEFPGAEYKHCCANAGTGESCYGKSPARRDGTSGELAEEGEGTAFGCKWSWPAPGEPEHPRGRSSVPAVALASGSWRMSAVSRRNAPSACSISNTKSTSGCYPPWSRSG